MSDPQDETTEDASGSDKRDFFDTLKSVTRTAARDIGKVARELGEGVGPTVRELREDLKPHTTNVREAVEGAADGLTRVVDSVIEGVREGLDEAREADVGPAAEAETSNDEGPPADESAEGPTKREL